MTTDTLLVIADDLTGANDTAVMFADAGFNTRLEINLASLNTTDFSKADVFSVSTDSRPLGIEAEIKTEQAILSGIKKGIAHIYLKIDSTMRGSVQHQINGALKAWSSLHPEAKAIICPAYPEMGRTIKKGHLHVNEIPVNETASGKDAICPVYSSLMTDLLPNATHLPCLPKDELISEITSSSSKQIVVDAESDTDLDVIASVINQLGNKMIPVGSAGLAQKLKHVKGRDHEEKHSIKSLGRILLVVTSIHDISQTQVDHYISTIGGDAIVFNPAPSQLINHQLSEEALKQQLNALITSSSSNVIIRANPAKVINTDESINEIARKIAKYLADLAKYALDSKQFDSLILFGGDGAAALLEKMDITELQVLYAIVPGVPLCEIDSGSYQGIKVMTKSGGFGNITLLNDIIG